MVAVASFRIKKLAFKSSESDCLIANDKPINNNIGMISIKNGDAELLFFFMAEDLMFLINRISIIKLQKNILYLQIKIFNQDFLPRLLPKTLPL